MKYLLILLLTGCVCKDKSHNHSDTDKAIKQCHEANLDVTFYRFDSQGKLTSMQCEPVGME